jgi:WD40 repeat protein
MTQAQPASRIFVSHSHSDNVFCRKLVKALRDSGFDVWYDEHNMKGEIERTIEQELRTRDTYIVVLSPGSVDSRWVRAEWNEALERLDRGLLRYLLPVIAEPCDIPLRLKTLFWTDFTKQTFNDTMAHLLMHMGLQEDDARARLEGKTFTPKLWDLKESINTYVNTFCVAWSPNGSLLASGAHDKRVRIWDVATGRSVATFDGHMSWVDAVAWSPDGHMIASASQGQRIRLWDSVTKREVLVLEGHQSGVVDVAWSSDGHFLLSGSEDKTARLWNITSGQCERIFTGATQPITSVAFSPDGNLVSASSRDALVYVWDLNSGKLIFTLAGHTDVIHCVRWSPDGSLIATSGHTTVRIWNASSRECIQKFEGHHGHVVSIAWRPQGDIIASASADHSVRLWGVNGEKIVITPGMHNDWVHTVAWSPNGLLLASSAGINDGTIKFWQPA